MTRLIMVVNTVVIALVLFFTSALVYPYNIAEAQVVTPVQIYDANPQSYSWSVVAPYGSGVRSGDRGRTFTGNLNAAGFEVYGCTSTNVSKDMRDFCIPRASNYGAGKLWSQDLLPGGLGDRCREQQKGYDGPNQASDTRRLNGTANSNANSNVCAGTTQGARAAVPFLNITKQFTYDTSFCAGSNRVILASRPDPANPICANLDYEDAGINFNNYSADQLQCLLYVDNTADLTACKGSSCRTINFTGQNSGGNNNDSYVLAQQYHNVCSIFNQGNGQYDVTLRAYDIGGVFGIGGVMYGSSSFWLSTLDYRPYTITGAIFNDANKNGIRDSGEANYAATPSITASRGTVTANSNGTYTISNVYPGAPVVVSYSSLPSGYKMTSPLNGPPPSFSVNVGSTGCTVNGAPGAACNTGNIVNLNYGINNSFPWVRTVCGDMRQDDGISNPAPSGQSSATTNASCSSPGVLFTGDSSATFGQGQASSTNQVVGGNTYPEVYGPGEIFSSHDTVAQKIQSGVTTTNLASICTLTNCTLPGNLPHGIYVANSDVTLNSVTFPANQNYVFLIDGNLTLRGNVTVPASTRTTDFFSVSGNIIIPSTVGSAATSGTANLVGIFSTDRSFIMQGNNNCTDLRLNIEGTVLVNAARSGGSLQNNRDLCGSNSTSPTLQLTQRLDFVLNLPEFLKTTSTISKETAP